jgi:hypothetical protein
LFSVLEKQLAASRHEMEEARLWEDRERVVVARIWQGAGVALAALLLRTSQDFRQVAPGFSGHARKAERAELVGGFAVAEATIVATVDVEDILCGGGQEP